MAPSSRRPALIAYAVRSPASAQQKRIWTRIGAAWPHENGAGYSVRRDGVRLDGRIVLTELAEPKIIDVGGPEAV
jgi:hypothetical protein